jgi:hypothetical protein
MSSDLTAADARIWELVVQHTGRVGYHRGTKAAGLDASPPVIDCSGWVGLLLSSAMKAQNAHAGKDIFDAGDISAWLRRGRLSIANPSFSLTMWLTRNGTASSSHHTVRSGVHRISREALAASRPPQPTALLMAAPGRRSAPSHSVGSRSSGSARCRWARTPAVPSQAGP